MEGTKRTRKKKSRLGRRPEGEGYKTPETGESPMNFCL